MQYMQWAIENAAKSIVSAHGSGDDLSKAIEMLAHEVDWESGDPKVLVLEVAKEIRKIDRSNDVF